MGKRGRKPSTTLFSDGTYSIEDFHQSFLEADDPTEYKPALALVGSWQEWLRLKKESPWFRKQVREWLEELEMKQRSEAIAKVRKLGESNKPAAFQANKWIAERRYADVSNAGRPSKAALAKEAREIASEAAETKEEASRIESAVINLDERRK
jgi:hypothetical protein